MTVRVGINGFGRIGRNFYRAVLAAGADIDVVAVNDLGEIEALAHLLQYDSVLGRLGSDVRVTADGIDVGGKTIRVLAHRDPADLPWGELAVDVVIESTGRFTDREDAAAHLDAGAPLVIVSAPSAGADRTIVVGVNDHEFDPATDRVISNASCTTNCFVPMVKVLDDAFGVTNGFMSTVHAYTGDQSLVDGPHRDLRRARAAAINVIPTSTGAARATGLVLQAMQGRLDGSALRVPVPTGSIIDFTVVLDRPATVEQINAAFATAATDGPMSRVLEYSTDPLVSSDIVGSAASCTFDAGLTMANDTLAKVSGWYDNEWGYSSRLVDLVQIAGS